MNDVPKNQIIMETEKEYEPLLNNFYYEHSHAVFIQLYGKFLVPLFWP